MATTRGGGECPTSRPRGAHCRAPGAAVPPCIAVPRRGCGFRSTASGWVGATVLQSSGCRCPREFGDLERHRAVVDTAQAPCSIDQFNRHGATTDRDRRASYGGPHAGARRRQARPLAATSRCGHGFGRASRRRRRAGRSARLARPQACRTSGHADSVGAIAVRVSSSQEARQDTIARCCSVDRESGHHHSPPTRNSHRLAPRANHDPTRMIAS